jgi:hypothetical protein
VTVAPLGAQTLLRLARAQTPAQATLVGRQSVAHELFYLHTDDFARDHALYLARGVRFLEPPRSEVYGTVAVFEELHGNRWDLIEHAR